MNRSLVRRSAFVVVCALTDLAHAGHGHGRGHALRAPQGWFLGVDTGAAWLLGPSDVAARATSPGAGDSPAWCFGARTGYQLRDGLAVQARYDRFGVDAPDSSSQLQVVSAGVRYSLPVVPMPFAEALVGPAIHDGGAAFAVALGAGVSLVVARHLALDASVRDWIFDIGGVHHVPTVMLGISAGFGG